MFFRRSFGRAPTAQPPGRSDAPDDDAPQTMRLGGHELPVVMRRSARARRLGLRVDARRDAVVLTLPPRTGSAAAHAFLAAHADWAAAQLAALPPRVAFADGAVVPLRGRDRVIRHDPAARAGVYTEGPDGETLVVSGRAEHLPRRLREHLKAEARADILPAAREKAAAIGRSPGRVTVRDQKTRWGSCTATGNLNFSWRLILCPPEILDYVVAHEVAHLRHMNHSPAFWATVAELAPAPDRARAWLRAHGQHLHRVG